MKLGRRQTQSISSILTEDRDEIRGAYQLRHETSSRSRLNEALMFEEVSLDHFHETVTRGIEADCHEMSSKLLVNFDRVLFKNMSEVLRDFGGDKQSGATLQEDLEDIVGDDLMLAQQELFVNLHNALEDYAKEVALLVQQVKLSPTDAPPGEE